MLMALAVMCMLAAYSPPMDHDTGPPVDASFAVMQVDGDAVEMRGVQPAIYYMENLIALHETATAELRDIATQTDAPTRLRHMHALLDTSYRGSGGAGGMSASPFAALA